MDNNTIIRQAKNLTYRVIDGNYYIINPVAKNTVILNKSAFEILEICNDVTFHKLCNTFLKDENNKMNITPTNYFNKNELLQFLYSLKNYELLEF